MNTKRIAALNQKRRQKNDIFPVWLSYKSVIDCYRVNATANRQFIIINGKRYRVSYHDYEYYKNKPSKHSFIAQVPVEVLDRMGIWYAAGETCGEGASTNEDVECVSCYLTPLLYISKPVMELILLLSAILGFAAFLGLLFWLGA